MTAVPTQCDLPPDVGEGVYGRLCPGSFPAYDESKLKEVAEHMHDCDRKRSAQGRPKRTPVMKSGYVYLGQFIDHDLTYDKTLVEKAHPNVGTIPNHRTPRLDLDSLYGKDPSQVGSLYDSDGSLKLGMTVAVNDTEHPAESSKSDLYRDSTGTPCMIDPRNDENLVVAQMHVLFAKLHNRVIELLNRRQDLAPDPKSSDTFQESRKLVTWLYQWIIVHEFLPSFVSSSVLDDVWHGTLRLYQRPLTPTDYPMPLPVEFTVAAYRFGHSMIQENYILNDYAGVETKKLITLTKKGGDIGTGPGSTLSLPANYVIDWDFFFSDSEPRVNRGQNIDTFITEALYTLPAQTIALFRDQTELRSLSGAWLQELHMPLPELTLVRGSKMQLPSGEEFAKRFNYPVIDRKYIPALEEDKALFDNPTFRDRTPLWYYLLREAALTRQREETISDRTPIQKLGPMGSQIVAEVFYQLLASDNGSIMHAGKSWRPPVFVFGRSGQTRALDSMSAVIEFVRYG